MTKGALRTGYTTGACAAAAAKAAVMTLLAQEPVHDATVTLPGGDAALFRTECRLNGASAVCTVIKYAGDDPDVTDGMALRAAVHWTGDARVTILAGEGIGVVTKPGLDVPPGEPAINPVPRQMIQQAVREAAGDRGVAVTISAPDGAARARRTLNARLGIVGGISILGTSGIVIPYSKEAYTACIQQSIAVAAASACRQAVLTTGRRSEKFAQAELHLPDECFIQAGDYIGYAIEQCARLRMERVTIWGMAGKMGKLAAGHLYTNVSDSLISIEFLTGVAKDCGIPDAILGTLRQSVTANHLRRLLPPSHTHPFYDRLCLMAARHCAGSVEANIQVACIVTDPDGHTLGRAEAHG